MKLPPSSSMRYKVLEIVYLHGPMSCPEIGKRLAAKRQDSAHGAVSWAAEEGLFQRDGRIYDLSPSARKYFDGLHIGVDTFVPQIAGPTLRGNAWTPEMKGYEANLRRLWRAA